MMRPPTLPPLVPPPPRVTRVIKQPFNKLSARIRGPFKTQPYGRTCDGLFSPSRWKAGEWGPDLAKPAGLVRINNEP